MNYSGFVGWATLKIPSPISWVWGFGIFWWSYLSAFISSSHESISIYFWMCTFVFSAMQNTRTQNNLSGSFWFCFSEDSFTYFVVWRIWRLRWVVFCIFFVLATSHREVIFENAFGFGMMSQARKSSSDCVGWVTLQIPSPFTWVWGSVSFILQLFWHLHVFSNVHVCLFFLRCRMYMCPCILVDTLYWRFLHPFRGFEDLASSLGVWFCFFFTKKHQQSGVSFKLVLGYVNDFRFS